MEGTLEHFQEAAAKEAREDPYGQEEVGPAGISVACPGRAAARHDTVQVRMMDQVLTPGVQYAKKPMSAPRCFDRRRSFSSLSGGLKEQL